mmetsp:Transcript_1465/g.4290  ORF Transcript_1465/g.4290 Transcript_1465/m.4290 type:complete len:278 (+) Transcript_1465:78-911(+)
MTRNNIGPRYWTYCRGVFDERSLPRSDGSPARAAAADPPTRALTTDLELDQARACKGEGRVPNLEVRLLLLSKPRAQQLALGAAQELHRNRRALHRVLSAPKVPGVPLEQLGQCERHCRIAAAATAAAAAGDGDGASEEGARDGVELRAEECGLVDGHRGEPRGGAAGEGKVEAVVGGGEGEAVARLWEDPLGEEGLWAARGRAQHVVLELREGEDVAADLVGDGVEEGDRLEQRGGRAEQRVRVLDHGVVDVEEEGELLLLVEPVEPHSLERGGGV